MRREGEDEGRQVFLRAKSLDGEVTHREKAE